MFARRLFSARAGANVSESLQEIYTQRANSLRKLRDEIKNHRASPHAGDPIATLKVLQPLATSADTKAAFRACLGKYEEIAAFERKIATFKPASTPWSELQDKEGIPGLSAKYKASYDAVTKGRAPLDPAQISAQAAAYHNEWLALGAAQGLGSLRGEALTAEVKKLHATLSAKYPAMATYVTDADIQAFVARASERDATTAQATKAVEANQVTSASLSEQVNQLNNAARRVSSMSMEEWTKENPALAQAIWEEIESGDFSFEITDEKRNKYLEIMKRVEAGSA